MAYRPATGSGPAAVAAAALTVTRRRTGHSSLVRFAFGERGQIAAGHAGHFDRGLLRIGGVEPDLRNGGRRRAGGRCEDHADQAENAARQNRPFPVHAVTVHAATGQGALPIAG